MLRSRLAIVKNHATDAVALVGNKVLLNWLEGLSHAYVASRSYLLVAMTYLLNNTISVNKSSNPSTHQIPKVPHWSRSLQWVRLGSNCTNLSLWPTVMCEFVFEHADGRLYEATHSKYFFCVYLIVSLLILNDATNSFMFIVMGVWALSTILTREKVQEYDCKQSIAVEGYQQG